MHPKDFTDEFFAAPYKDAGVPITRTIDNRSPQLEVARGAEKNMAKRKTSMNGFADLSLKIVPQPVEQVELAGKRVAIVGGTDGIGRALAQLAAARGADVLVVGRTFRDEGHPRIRFMNADLSSMAEARKVAAALDPSLDVVVFTTGIFAAKTRQVTDEGIERDLAVSTLSRLEILRTFVPRLASRSANAAKPRFFVMGFPGAGELGDVDNMNAERSYDAMKVHMNTVATNEALVIDMQKRHPNLLFFGLNPGLIRTNIRANFLGEGSLVHKSAEFLIGLFTPTAEQYAVRILWLLVAPELEGRGGAMFGKKGQAILPTQGLDATHAARLVGAAEALLNKTRA